MCSPGTCRHLPSRGLEKDRARSTPGVATRDDVIEFLFGFYNCACPIAQQLTASRGVGCVRVLVNSCGA